MVDPLSPEQRSALMARVRQKNTKPELLVRKLIHAQGLRYVLHPTHLPGRPDLLFPKYNAAIFVHGCFWHGHTCRAGRAPTTNSIFWEEKIKANKDRDARKTTQLEAQGWRVYCIWECETKGDDLGTRVSSLVRSIKRLTDKNQIGPTGDNE